MRISRLDSRSRGRPAGAQRMSKLPVLLGLLAFVLMGASTLVAFFRPYQFKNKTGGDYRPTIGVSTVIGFLAIACAFAAGALT